MVSESFMTPVNATARLTCTARNDDPVHLFMNKSMPPFKDLIYVGENDRTFGNFSVEVNSTLRRYTLVIKDVKISDGRFYCCTDEQGYGETACAELVVWGRCCYS